MFSSKIKGAAVKEVLDEFLRLIKIHLNMVTWKVSSKVLNLDLLQKQHQLKNRIQA